MENPQCLAAGSIGGRLPEEQESIGQHGQHGRRAERQSLSKGRQGVGTGCPKKEDEAGLSGQPQGSPELGLGPNKH